MKKKVLTILISVLTIVTLCIVFASCEKKEATCENGGAHKWGSWDTTPATCAKAGQKIRTCDICGEEEEQASYADRNPATGIHNYNSDGNCMVCGMNRCSAGNHAYGQYTTTIPTCVSDERRSRVCSLCGEEQVDNAFIGRPATGNHTYVDYTCTVCGQVSPDKPNCTQGGPIHNWVLQSESAATCTKDGTATYKCADCPKSKTEVIEQKFDHSFGATKMGALQYEQTCTVCGAKQVRKLKNLASSVLPELDPTEGGFGLSEAIFNNGNWDESAWGAGCALKGSGATITFNFASPEKVDQIAIATDVGGFSISVITNKSGGEYKTITSGVAGWGKENAFLCNMSEHLDDDELVLSVRVTQTSREDGSKKWGEIGIGQIDESKGWEDA